MYMVDISPSIMGSTDQLILGGTTLQGREKNKKAGYSREVSSGNAHGSIVDSHRKRW